MTMEPPWQWEHDHIVLTAGDRAFALEIGAGSGRLTAELRSIGFDAWGIDHRTGKIAPETPAIIFLDLESEQDSRRLLNLFNHPMLKVVHIAPPCGTCSRARDIRPGPPPLRRSASPAIAR